jgi:hypothetical protein
MFFEGSIEHDFALVLEMWVNTGTVAGVQGMGVKERSSAAAEKGIEGMA